MQERRRQKFEARRGAARAAAALAAAGLLALAAWRAGGSGGRQPAGEPDRGAPTAGVAAAGPRATAPPVASTPTAPPAPASVPTPASTPPGPPDPGRPEPGTGDFVLPDAEVAARAAFRAPDGSTTFRVPQPADPEYADYLEMLAWVKGRSALHHVPGYAPPYDPEWRAARTGRRAAAPVDRPLEAGASQLDELAAAILAGLRVRDPAALQAVRVTRAEFEVILWPEFPQSRPYLKIPVHEAWGFQDARSHQGVKEALGRFGGRDLVLEGLRWGRRLPYTNFTLYRDLVIEARDPRTGEPVDVDVAPAVVERLGRFKVLVYDD